MSSPAELPVAGAPASQPVFPDEILEDIFLRLDAAADLARSSAACTTFRRVVSGRRFRRRFRSLHPPPVLGFLKFYAPGAFHPAERPHRSAPAARALARAADFSFSFLGDPDDWRVCDARDGRVLLYRCVDSTAAFADLRVADPLHRRYIQLPPIPDDLADATDKENVEFDPFLDPATDEEENDLSFRVIWAVQCQHKLDTFHFSSVTGKWRGITFNRPTPLDPSMVEDCNKFERHYAHSCFYWRFWGAGSLFILDTREMKFSVIDHDQLPIKYGHQQQAIVEVGEDRLGIVILGDGVLELYSKTLGNKNNGINTEEWQHDKIILLPQMEPTQRPWSKRTHAYWSIQGAAEGHLLLRVISPIPPKIRSATPRSHYFTVDLKTFLVERLCMSKRYVTGAHLYASFPPSLSPPTI
ncbi:unnamed protein product [Urochloa decumbens]|uniref:F-box domain-containing protein n=1 Tax=Urochloa decumbens TaxID=240449 RepID=A0ABC8VHK2_9POAL